MELTPHLEAIREDLGSLLGSDEAAAQALERVARALDATLQLRLIEVLGEGALELTEQLPVGHAEVRVSGRDAGLVYVGPPDPTPPPPGPDEEHETARILAVTRERGLLLLRSGMHHNVIRTLMPLTIPDDQLTEGLDILGSALAEVAGAPVRSER